MLVRAVLILLLGRGASFGVSVRWLDRSRTACPSLDLAVCASASLSLRISVRTVVIHESISSALLNTIKKLDARLLGSLLNIDSVRGAGVGFIAVETSSEIRRTQCRPGMQSVTKAADLGVSWSTFSGMRS